MNRAFTANRLSDGAVVFLDGSYGWSETFAVARLFSTEGELQDLTRIASRAEATGQIVGAYPIEVSVDPTDGAAKPSRLRERIRAFGPTPFNEPARRTA